jgi:hypothetical protein
MSIIASLRSLAWTMVLLFMLIYSASVYFTQLVADCSEPSSELLRYFGTLDVTILVLFQSITGGVDWNDVADPLILDISAFMGILFCFYIAFSVLAVMNVVTGVFVESALLSARADQDIFMVNNLRDLFESVAIDKNMDRESSGKPTDLSMTWEDFINRINTVQMQDYFKSIDVDPSDARGIFTLLDQDNSGCITFEEFVSGCCRLRGGAKALDIHILLHELRRFSSKMDAHTQYVETGCHFKKLAKFIPKPKQLHSRSHSKSMSMHSVRDNEAAIAMQRGESTSAQPDGEQSREPDVQLINGPSMSSVLGSPVASDLLTTGVSTVSMTASSKPDSLPEDQFHPSQLATSSF